MTRLPATGDESFGRLFTDKRDAARKDARDVGLHANGSRKAPTLAHATDRPLGK